MASPLVTLISLTSVVGLCIGSFLNVVIHRVPKMMERSWRRDVIDTLRHLAGSSDTTDAERKDMEQGALTLEQNTARLFTRTYNLVLPHSSCPNCGHSIRPWENIPVISYLFLRGRCSSCKKPISLRYPLVELATGLLSGLLALHFGFSMQLVGALILLWFLVGLTMIDIDTQFLPDSMTLPLLWLGLLFNIRGVFAPLPQAVIGAVAGYLLLWSVYWIFKLLTGREGMGYGDFKLLAALGAWLGFLQLPLIILAASVSGLVFALVQIAGSRLGWGQKIPFGPYLASGGLLALIWGDRIMAWYLAPV